MLASADAVASGGAVFSAQTVEASGYGIAHAGVKVRLGGIGGCNLRVGKCRDFRGEIEIVLIGGEFRAVPRIGHAVLKFRRGAPDAPPERFGFEEIPERM